jgi:hypothetical protein
MPKAKKSNVSFAETDEVIEYDDAARLPSKRSHHRRSMMSQLMSPNRSPRRAQRPVG